jgi:hypothetical protein
VDKEIAHQRAAQLKRNSPVMVKGTVSKICFPEYDQNGNKNFRTHFGVVIQLENVRGE